MMESETKIRNSHTNEFVKATNLETNEVKFFKNGIDASCEIGCSHVLVYKALRNQGAQVDGWKLEYISKDDPQCATFKKELEDRRRDLRKSFVEHVREQMRKRKQFVEGEKAQRKAEHDEIVRTLRGYLSALGENIRNQLESEAIEYRQAFSQYHAIVQKTMDGEFVRQWDSAHQAEKETNIKNIRQVVLGLRQSAGGYKWEFLVQQEE